MSDLIKRLVGAQIYELGRPLERSTPVSPNHPPYRMALIRRHGDVMRPDGTSGANELLSLGGHTGTHIDGLAHVASNGRLHGGADAFEASRGGVFKTHGVEMIAPIFAHGILLDVPRWHGVDVLDPAYPITDAALESTAHHQGTMPEAGDVVLIRTGWAVENYQSPDRYIGYASGVPGPDLSGAKWLSSRKVRAVGADTLAFEWLAPKAGHSLLPVHSHLLVEHGIHILEVLDFEEIAELGLHDFLFVALPLRLTGATGSPVRPIAVAV